MAHPSQPFGSIGRSNAAMQLATAAFLAVFLLTSLAVGIRLVALHLRTRRPPELLIGMGILGVGPLGMGGLLVAAGLDAAGSGAAPYAAGIAALAIVVGFVAAGLFNWQVYRPESTAARLVIGIGVLLGGIGFGIEIGTTGFADPLHPGPGIVLITTCNALTLIWGATESLLYWRLMRRRLALGLAEPRVTNRFLLYGVGIGSAGAGAIISRAAQELLGKGMAEMPLLMLSNSLFGLVAAVCMGVAFLPPRAWRRWIAGSAS
jgi:hypothetical protein